MDILQVNNAVFWNIPISLIVVILLLIIVFINLRKDSLCHRNFTLDRNTMTLVFFVFNICILFFILLYLIFLSFWFMYLEPTILNSFMFILGICPLERTSFLFTFIIVLTHLFGFSSVILFYTSLLWPFWVFIVFY